MTPKFRVWDKVRKRMNEVKAIIYTENKVYPMYSKKIRIYIPLNETILMQSTGLFDKNGKEIFEGDVVKLVNEYDSGISTVILQEGALGMIIEEVFVPFAAISILSCIDYTLEIIGNIYKNPELLEETK